MEHRDDSGRFVAKSDSDRKVRSIRATDRTWDDFGFLADQQRITRADLLEQWAKSGPPSVATGNDGGPTPLEIAIAVDILREALTLRANAGGAIKAKIRSALVELGCLDLG